MENVFVDITNIKHKRIKVRVLTSNPRKKLFRWIYEVIRDFDYSLQTFIKFVYIFDEYNKVKISSQIYQLVGITCLFIAAKLEETYIKPIRHYSLVTDKSCNVQDILEMETKILNKIQFKIKNNIKLTENNVKNIIICYLMETESYFKDYFLIKKMESVYEEYLNGRISEDLDFYLKNSVNLKD